ncbi:lipoyl domain-containing protein [Halanaeroarchaeum sulfurireducens]|uniref:Biotin/lipoyl attachment domain-containing protein n=1 Tax=Halanaeroarchaeum sulfurireducens TaxID=1604004 RepID=A0A0N9N255_9EURY|nr:lipoyl domain-containing protein [Halanaeroarchaeum sulfurireducens]ALG81236.1 biotin/lipoyl attachment domain-containing protein [Halanaeroarchaeum sulfurireducens]
MSGDRTPVAVDDIWPEDTDPEEGVVVDWYVSEGASVEDGETLCTIQVEKVDIDVPAPVGGTLAEIVLHEEQVCGPGDTLAWIES